MTAAQGELCRITVYGPRGRADLAVPTSVPVSSLLPILLRHTGGPGAPDEPWVLQRLGEAPFDPVGTAESLDWREGEEFHLRRREDPLPELDFDDIAEGMATAVSRQPGRWRPEFNRWLFLGFAIFSLTVLARLLLYLDVTAIAAGGCGLASVGLLISAISSGTVSEDRALLLLLGLGACGFAFLGGATSVAGVSGLLALQASPVLVGCVTFAVAGGVVLAGRAAWAPAMPFVPFATVTATGAGGAIAVWLHLGVGFSQAQAAGTTSAVLIVLLVFAPRIGIRFARIRGPQLPRTADELQYDIEPAPAERMVRQTAYADGYLTVACLAAAVVFTCAFPFLVAGGLLAACLAGLSAVAVLMRSRSLLGAWQRVPLAAAGSVGLAVLVLLFAGSWSQAWQAAAGVGLVLVFFLLVMAMLRPPPRRLLPVWGHLANYAETVSAIALVPLLLQLFGVYAWFAGLVG